MTTLAVREKICQACGERFMEDPTGRDPLDVANALEEQFNVHAERHRVGFCLKCLRWAPWGNACPRFGQLFDLQHECHQELKHQFAMLVLALQDVVPHSEVKEKVQLDPKLWGAEARGIVKAAMSPLFWSNMTTADMRMALGLLTAVSGQYGIVVGDRSKAGVEVVLADDAGKRWVYWQDAKTGMLTRVGEMVDTAPPENPEPLRTLHPRSR